MERIVLRRGRSRAAASWNADSCSPLICWKVLQVQSCLRRRRVSLRYRPLMPRESPNRTGMLEAALELHRKSLRLVPLLGKRAIVKDWPNLHLSEADVLSWCRRGVNWGIITGEPLVVLDTDTEQAEEWVKQRRIESPVMVRSGGGGLHRYFLSPQGGEIRSTSAAHGVPGLDVKGYRSYIVAAGSIHPQTRRPYAYLPGRELLEPHELPEFNPAWLHGIREEPSAKPRTGEYGKRIAGHIRDVRAYVRGIPSVEGSGGDRACFTVACFLAEAGFGFDEALAEMIDWNLTNAFPPWEVRELERKLRYAFARVVGK